MSTLRIGIVDDNSFLMKAIEDKLSFFDAVSVRLKAINGKDLLDKLQQISLLDVILMDIEMPVMNGIEATFQVKQKFP
ncbi:MAG: response regulator, partial [Flavobacterium sp.]